MGDSNDRLSIFAAKTVTRYQTANFAIVLRKRCGRLKMQVNKWLAGGQQPKVLAWRGLRHQREQESYRAHGRHQLSASNLKVMTAA